MLPYPILITADSATRSWFGRKKRFGFVFSSHPHQHCPVGCGPFVEAIQVSSLVSQGEL